MPIDVKIADKPFWSVDNYSVDEDSTPVNPADSTGGYGQFTFGIPDTDENLLLRGKVVDLSDGTQGKTQGIITGLAGDGDIITVSADSKLSRTSVTRTAQPFVGTLEGAFRYYLGLVGYTAGIVVDTTIASRSVVFPGWSANVWDQLKKLCAAQQVELTLASNNAVLRPLRGRTAINYRDTSAHFTIDDTGIAQSVELYAYNTEWRTGGLAYPLGGWNDKVTVQQGLAAGSRTEVDIPLEPDSDSTLGVSLTSVQQPSAVDNVDRGYSASSVYSVLGNDNLNYPAADWVAGGGSVTVSIGEDTRSIKLVIVAPNDASRAPFQLAMPNPDNTSYSSLRIVGDGVFYDRKLHDFLTGNSADRAPTEVGATVDNEFVNSYEDVFRSGQWAAAAYTGPRQTINVSTSGINRRGDTGNYRYPTMGDANVDPDFAGKTMGEINAEFTGWSFKQFSDYELAKVANDFDNQAFGNVAGARVFHRGQWYRIRSVSGMGPSGLSYTAERDTIMGDANDAYTGKTMGEMNALFTGKTMGEVSIAPLPMEV